MLGDQPALEVGVVGQSLSSSGDSQDLRQNGVPPRQGGHHGVRDAMHRGRGRRNPNPRIKEGVQRDRAVVGVHHRDFDDPRATVQSCGLQVNQNTRLRLKHGVRPVHRLSDRAQQH